MRYVVAAVSLFVFSVGCSHVKPRENSTGDSTAPRTVGEVIRQDLKKEKTQATQAYDGDLVVNGVKLKNTQFDIPVVVNSRVEYWVDYFTVRGRPHFEKYLERSEFFIPYIRPILKQNGMPEDLVYLAMIESGFNNLARSRAKAVGPWQFISATGKRYGLKVNWWVDERRDIRKSTLSAVGYLRDLYQMFQSWELAAASYNSGEAKIARAIQRYGTKDFWELSRHRFLKPETRDYVPKIMAAAIIAKNRELFGFKASTLHPAADEVVAGDGAIVKVIKTDKPEEKVDRVADTLAQVEDDDDDVDDSDQVATAVPQEPVPVVGEVASSVKAVPVTPHLTKSGEISGVQLVEFELDGPADLLKVARASGLSYQTVKSLNPELMRWCTPPKVAAYRLKLPETLKDKFLETYNHAAFPRKVEFMGYKVKRGDTLARIARHFGIKADPMADLNGVSPQVPLRAGSRVILPIPNDQTRSLASLEVRDPPEKRRSRRSGKKKIRTYRITHKHRESARSVEHGGLGDG
ncbi:transglycosylase SLT domain-containing protein [Bdellovibrionota bacterium FG-2]